MTPSPKELTPEGLRTRGAISWMAGNSVAANLLMFILLIGGLFMGFQIKQEVFPEFDLDRISVSVSYPGASPEEVESGIILSIEEAIQDLEGIDEISSTASEGHASISVLALEDTDINRLWQEIKSEVDRISTLPENAEDPQVSIAVRKREVLRLALFGDTDEITMRRLADQVRDRFLAIEEITQVELEGIRDQEIHVEVDQAALRRYNLTLQDVAQALARASVDSAGGSIKTRGGDILLRINDRKDYATEYAQLPIISLADGSKILLEDIALVKEGFEDTDAWASYNGKRAVLIEIYRVGDQTPIQVAGAGKKAIEEINADLPPGIHLDQIRDLSNIFNQRADLLLRNAYIGLSLVFIFLALFLEIRLAFWVSLGIPISFLGSFLFLSPTSFSINMVSMFAFIVTLGIVVDDAVVVGENIYARRKEGVPMLRSAIEGTREIAMPVVFSVITNMITFIPLLFVPGIIGKVFHTIPYVVIAVFGVSLIESLFILPAHLGHQKGRPLFWPLNYLEQGQAWFSKKFIAFVKKVYGPFLSLTISYRYAVIAFGMALLMITAGYVSSGRMGMVLFPRIESDYAFVEANLPFGAPISEVIRIEQELVNHAKAVVEENGSESLSTGIFSEVRNNRVRVRVFLVPPEIRPKSTSNVTRLWQDRVGRPMGIESISFQSNRGGPGSGKNLTVSLSHRDNDLLEKAGTLLAEKLSSYTIVHDIDDGSAKGKLQYNFSLNDAGKRMGLTSREVALQIRGAFQGFNAVRNQRDRNEITVRVRLPEAERNALISLENLVLKSPQGEIMLRDAVRIEIDRAFTSIRRVDGKRITSVTANVRPPSEAENVISDMKKQILPELVSMYPGLSYTFRGHQASIRDSIKVLMKGLLIALVCIFALLAIPFKSYFQPLIIMFCIPFGMVGAVAGHLIMGYSLSVMSLFGLVAMTGVVINDSLVLIDFANRRRREGMLLKDAVRMAGVQRFRPILLTTLTTCGGLAPIILETSRQAKFLIPMAISLGFGILFATFITLVMVPCLYMILEDVIRVFKWIYGPSPPAAVTHEPLEYKQEPVRIRETRN
ncbi:MAG: efflux RND transporter permease subunit [Desulfobacteraceae bacterium]|nr:MAG: efflux RND transporter permease subunit [Desulfobacteraceae bacterium]